MVSCYYCGRELIKEDSALVKVPFNNKGKNTMVERLVHQECATDIIKRFEDKEDSEDEDYWWDKAYQKLKDLVIFSGDANRDAELKHMVLRLRGLYSGNYMPKNVNAKRLKTGYTYEEIYTAIVFSSIRIKKGVRDIEFQDGQHRINYVMSMITKNIDLVSSRLADKREKESALDRRKVPNLESKYIKKYEKTDKKENKVEQAWKIMENESKSEDDLDVKFGDFFNDL